MTDNEYYYRDQMKELQNVNAFVRVNTLRIILNKLEWFKSMEEVLKYNYEILKRNVTKTYPYAFNKLTEIYGEKKKLI